MTERQYQVLARSRKSNFVSQMYRRPNGRIVRSSKPLGDGKWFSHDEAKRAQRLGEARGWAVFVTKSHFPFIVLDSDTKMVRPQLAVLINELGRKRGRYVWLGEGWRTHARQWELYREYERRGFAPPTVAYPGTSNHEFGWAGDISILISGRGGAYINVGNDAKCRRIMKRLGLGLPVVGEPWHAQITSEWRA